MFRNWINNLLFSNYYANIVHNKTIVKTVEMKNFFNEVWYFVELFLVNVTPFLFVFDWNKTKMGTIQIHDHITVNNHR